MNFETTIPGLPERRANRKAQPVTKQQILAALDEYAAASRAWCGHGPEVTAKRAVVSQMLDEAGLV